MSRTQPILSAGLNSINLRSSLKKSNIVDSIAHVGFHLEPNVLARFQIRWWQRVSNSYLEVDHCTGAQVVQTMHTMISAVLNSIFLCSSFRIAQMLDSRARVGLGLQSFCTIPSRMLKRCLEVSVESFEFHVGLETV